MRDNGAQCKCGTVEELAAERKSPIEYDKKLNEYNLVAGSGKIRYRLYFCFFCGGRLPESDRTGLFTEPSQEEAKEVAQLTGKVASLQQAIQVLGKPDETVKAPKSVPDGVEYTRHHRYLSRWRTLDLTVRERKDGSIDIAFTGKYRGKSSDSAKKAQKAS
jgi:hypothetical protein